MKIINQYSKYIPYLYYITIIAFWFTDVNRSEGITAYPILLFGIPFLWQIIKPSEKLNFILGITFVCLSSYLIVAYIFNLINGLESSFLFYTGLFVIVNFLMALWIIRNSLKRTL